MELPEKGREDEHVDNEEGQSKAESSKVSATQVILDQQGPMACGPTGSMRETPRDSHILRSSWLMLTQLEELYQVELRLWPGQPSSQTKEGCGVLL